MVLMALPTTHPHLLADPFGDRHGSDSPRLRAANHAVVAVSILVEELGELSGLAATSFADDNDD